MFLRVQIWEFDPKKIEGLACMEFSFLKQVGDKRWEFNASKSCFNVMQIGRSRIALFVTRVPQTWAMKRGGRAPRGSKKLCDVIYE